MSQYNPNTTFVEKPFVAHCFKHNLEHQQKMQSYLNLRKTHFSMRFARNKNDKASPEHSPQSTSFPVVVNNRLRSFKSERCVNFVQDYENIENPQRSGRQRSPCRKKVPRENANIDRKEKSLQSFGAMFETIKIKKVGLTLKGPDRMRLTETSFNKKLNICRKGSLMTVLPSCGRRSSKSRKREMICGWQTSLPEYYC